MTSRTATALFVSTDPSLIEAVQGVIVSIGNLDTEGRRRDRWG